jgi:plasmid stabilization system protein ParE
MAVNLTCRPQVREDLPVIYEFIGLENPAAAERLYTSIENKASRLVTLSANGTAPPRYPAFRAHLARRPVSHFVPNPT